MAYFRSGRRQAPSTILGWPASPSLPDQKTLILGATLILLATLIKRRLLRHTHGIRETDKLGSADPYPTFNAPDALYAQSS